MRKAQDRMTLMKRTAKQYLDAMEGYFGPNEETSHHVFQLVKTRTEQECMGIAHKGSRMIPVGSNAIYESAIHVDKGRVSCYVCVPCADKWIDEIFPEEQLQAFEDIPFSNDPIDFGPSDIMAEESE